MKTLVVDKNTDLNKAGKPVEQANGNAAKPNPVTEENRNPKFVADNPVNKESAKPAEAPKAGGVQTPEAAKPEVPKAEAAPQVQAAQVAEPQKPVLNLAGTLKVVEELHKRKVHRDKLIEEIKNLEAFDIDLKDEDEEDNGRNFYQGCRLSIEDGNGRTFSTKNATVIWTVAQMVNSLFVNKLAEIEANITLPLV